MGFGWRNVRISMACCVLDCLAFIPFITLGMLHISLFWASFSLIQMCLLRLAVLGIFSLHDIGVLNFGEFWHLSFSSNGQGAFWLF